MEIFGNTSGYQLCLVFSFVAPQNIALYEWLPVYLSNGTLPPYPGEQSEKDTVDTKGEEEQAIDC